MAKHLASIGAQLAALALVSAPGLAADFHVDHALDFADSAPGDGSCASDSDSAPGSCTLRAAVEEANAAPGADVIHVPAGYYALTLGSLDIHDSVRILGAQNGTTTLGANGESRVFFIAEPQAGDWKRLRAHAGRESVDGLRDSHTMLPDAFAMPGDFRGSSDRMHVELHHLVIRDGYADDFGGGIYNAGALLLLNRSEVWNCWAFSQGAGIYNNEGSVLSVVRSRISGNGGEVLGGQIDGPARAGGIFNDNDAFLELLNSTVDHNNANRFGGIQSHGHLIARNSTISGNQGDVDTAGFSNTGEAYLNNVTLTDNHVLHHPGNGNPWAAGGVSNTGELYAANSIVAGNTIPLVDRQDCSGDFFSVGYNLIEATDGCSLVGPGTGDLLGQDPELEALTQSAGATPTHALASDSPARDAGNPAFPSGLAAACEPTDQRDKARGMGPSVGRCDIGAFERAGAPGQLTGF